jgi:hypothetical protein
VSLGVGQGVVRAWRLSKARYAGDFTGQGAARDGQRWNQPGQRAVYLGLSAYDVPDGPGLMTEVDPSALPEGWNAIPPSQADRGSPPCRALMRVGFPPTPHAPGSPTHPDHRWCGIHRPPRAGRRRGCGSTRSRR